MKCHKENTEYFPSFIFTPDNSTSDEKLIDVLLFAPVLHNFPNGTKFPNISLPFFEGLLYLTPISVSPTIWLISELVLADGVFICEKPRIDTKNKGINSNDFIII